MKNTCPFCESEIDEQLALYGGNCPHCFGEIPGEEAATDPGEAVKEKQAVSDARRTKLRTYLPIALAVPVLGLMVGFAAMKALETEPELEVMDFDSMQLAMPELDQLLVASLDEPKQEETVTKSKRRRASTSPGVGHAARVLGNKEAGAAGPTLGETEGDVLSALGTDSYDPKEGPRVRKVSNTDTMPDMMASTSSGSMQTGMKMSGTNMGTANIAVAKTRLKDRRQIQQMVLRVLQNQLPRLRSCYESRLRSDANLAGKWTLSFTVNSDGKVENSRAVGQGVRDNLLESCVVGKIDKWRFQPIHGSMPVKKTVTFDRR